MLTVSKASWAAGYIPELPTPFDKTGGLDLGSLTNLCERLVEAGVSAIVVGGTAVECAGQRMNHGG
jgi:4-hydroxy-tetrahydrodipicolinate synthase